MNNLRDIATVFLADEVDFAELYQAIDDFRVCLLDLTQLGLDDDSLRNDVHLSEGLAIGTEWAVRCVDDILRTKRFVKGLAEAIDYQLYQGLKPIELLYAGSGPFATLVLPLLSRYSPEELQLTLVEINEVSFKTVRRVFEGDDFRPYLRALYQADATTLQLNDPERYDILLSETMQYALQKEPQVAITLNLLPQLREDALLIPAEISLHLAAIEYGSTGTVKSRALAELLVISRKALSGHPPLLQDGATQFPMIEHQLVDEDIANAHKLGISTTIKIFGTQSLGLNESGLTIPKAVFNTDSLPVGRKMISAQYHLGAVPGMILTVT
ncbi:hypothetical protein [Neolewinella agarilytica]|uniref:hypothetical protein n=1 Tax=Neolewinella agarilytica TaxID=478744 RepID=UPI00235548D9|nr:hypothetical protein [Neolewinella agarilytica]